MSLVFGERACTGHELSSFLPKVMSLDKLVRELCVLVPRAPLSTSRSASVVPGQLLQVMSCCERPYTGHERSATVEGTKRL